MRSITMFTAAALLLSACGTSTEVAPMASPSGTSSAAASTAAAPVTVANAYVKAMDGATMSNAPLMTGAFMTLMNTTDRDLTLTGGTATFAKQVQVHEIVQGVMRQKHGGLVIPAGGSVTLQPGGNHVMFVGMAAPLLAGDEADFTLQFADGSAVTVHAPVKAMNAGSETYQPMPSMGGGSMQGSASATPSM